MDAQSFLERLAIHLTSWEATTFLVGEYTQSEADYSPVFTLADGILWLYQSIDGNSGVRKLQAMNDARAGTVAGAAHPPDYARGPARFSPDQHANYRCRQTARQTSVDRCARPGRDAWRHLADESEGARARDALILGPADDALTLGHQPVGEPASASA